MAVSGIVLSRHQRLQPKTATVVFGAECRARTLHLTHHYKAAQQIMDGLMSVVDGSEAPRLILNDHCALCEFRTECRQQAIKSDDLSLLGHMTAKKIAHYAQTGTLTVTQLSYTYLGSDAPLWAGSRVSVAFRPTGTAQRCRCCRRA